MIKHWHCVARNACPVILTASRVELVACHCRRAGLARYVFDRISVRLPE